MNGPDFGHDWIEKTDNQTNVMGSNWKQIKQQHQSLSVF